MQKTNFLNTGIAAPFCWYKTVTTNIDREDAKSEPQILLKAESS